MKLAPTLRESIAQTILTAIDSSLENPATLEMYGGEMPVSMGEEITDTLLATFNMSQPSGTVDGGTLNIATPDDATGLAEADAGWARLLDGDGGEVAYFGVGVTNSGETIEMNTVQVVVGLPVRITSFIFVVGGV